MTQSDYEKKLSQCSKSIADLPPGEINYYLQLLVNSIKPHHSKITNEFVDELQKFIHLLNNFQPNALANKEDIEQFYKQHLNTLLESYETLCELSTLSRWSVKIGYGLLNVAGALCALLTGFLGGLIGGIAGLGRSVLTLSNPFSGGFIGLATGVFFGAAVGFRAPKALFKNELSRQVKFCLNGMHHCMEKLEKYQSDTFETFKEQTRNELRTLFDTDNDFKNFLVKENNPFEIYSYNAEFISPTLEGYVGQHGLIKIPIGDAPSIQIEFTSSPTNIKRKPVKTDVRSASGEKIVEMIALHKWMQETHVFSLPYVFKQMKPGENDCWTYVNKVLLGTGQKTTSGRFSGEENWVGRNIVQFFVTKLSPFKPDILDDVPTLTVN